MSIRLNKALRELNIGLQTAVEFLEKRKDLGEVKAEPSFKLSDQQYKALNDAFSQDKEVRDQAEKLITKKAKDKKRAPEQKDHRAESLLESSNQQQYKPLGKIDLDSIGKGKSVESAAKKSEAPKHETAAVSHAPVKDAHRNEPKHDQRSTHGSHQKQEMKQENQQKSQQPKMNDFKGQKNAAQGNKNVEAQQQNAEQKAADNSQPSSVFTLKSEKKYTSNEPKVLGKIDLSSLNQSTRPKKKSKEERRKEREEKLAQQFVSTRSVLTSMPRLRTTVPMVMARIRATMVATTRRIETRIEIIIITIITTAAITITTVAISARLRWTTRL